jgi:hypothetical protein
VKLEYQLFDFVAARVITKTREIDVQESLERNAFAKLLKRKAENVPSHPGKPRRRALGIG